MCSRIVWVGEDGEPVIVGRNMDWFEDMGSNIWIHPRGMEYNGLTSENPLKWSSKYGSVVTTGYDIAAADGVNEKGLDGNLLFLAESDYGKRDTRLPGLSLSLWLQYFLDNFAIGRGGRRSHKKAPVPATSGDGRDKREKAYTPAFISRG